ncbi:RNA polymerase sigma factor [Maricaulis sp. CAU 1757]
MSDARSEGGTDDGELARRAADGDERAFAALVDRHGARLTRYLQGAAGSRSVADDVAQDTLVAVYRNLHRFDPARSFETWLFAIARNKLRDHFRRLAVRRWLGGGEAMDEVADPAPVPDIIAADREALQQVQAFVAELPEGLSTPLLLSAVEGLSLPDIGKVLGLSTKAVELRIYRARRRLKHYMGREG